MTLETRVVLVHEEFQQMDSFTEIAKIVFADTVVQKKEALFAAVRFRFVVTRTRLLKLPELLQGIGLDEVITSLEFF